MTSKDDEQEASKGKGKGIMPAVKTSVINIDDIAPEAWHDWGILQNLLDQIVDIQEKTLFLQSIVSRNQYICYDGRCPVFDEIRDIRAGVIDLGKAFTSFQKINDAHVSNFIKREKSDLLERLFHDCDSTLQELMRVASTNRAKMSLKREENEIRLELIKELNKSRIPIPFGVGKEVQDFLNEYKGFDEYDDKHENKKDDEDEEKKKGKKKQGKKKES